MLTGSMPSAVFIADGVPVTLVQPGGHRSASAREGGPTRRALGRLRRLARDVDERWTARGPHVATGAPDGLRHV